MPNWADWFLDSGVRVGRIYGFGRLVVKVCEFGGLEVKLFRQFLFMFMFLEFAKVC